MRVRHLFSTLGWRSVLAAAICALSATPALAASKIWSGGGGDANWMTGANWQGGVAPLAGDDLFFPDGALQLTNNNNFPIGTAFASITFSGTAPGYHLNGNAVNVTSAITSNNTTGLHIINLGLVITGSLTITQSTGLGSSALALEGIISGTGNLVVQGSGEIDVQGANTYTGTTTVSIGRYSVGVSPTALGTADGTSATGTFITSGGHLQIASGPFTIANEWLQVAGCGPDANDAFTVNVSNVSWTGPVVLAGGQDCIGAEGAAASLTMSGLVSGTGTFVKTGSGTVTITNNNSFPAGSVPTGTLIVNGTQGLTPFTVGGGTLGGAGTVGDVMVAPGQLSPGSSPAVLNTGSISLIPGTFVAELNGLTPGQYDQANVSGTVTLSGATLQATLGFAPAPGSTFTIINNDGADPVTGTFTGLPEGAALVISGTPFTITYAGGTGNDVVLAVAGAVPAVPVTVQWIVALMLGAMAIGTLARRRATRSALR